MLQPSQMVEAFSNPFAVDGGGGGGIGSGGGCGAGAGDADAEDACEDEGRQRAIRGVSGKEGSSHETKSRLESCGVAAPGLTLTVVNSETGVLR